MKKPAAFLLLSLLATAAVAAPKTPPPAYPITIHVIFSRGIAIQHLQAIVNGQQVELTSWSPNSVAVPEGVLPPGDYKARYIDMSPKRWDGIDVAGRYEIVVIDNLTRLFDVTGLGPKDSSTNLPAPPTPEPAQ